MAAPGSARAATLSEDFDSAGAGWESSGLWHVQDRPETVAVSPAIAGVLTSVPTTATLPAAATGSSAAWFGDPATGTYCVGYGAVAQHPSDGCRSDERVEGALTSPPFSVTAPATLHFKAWWEIGASDFEESDQMTVEYSTDTGATWAVASQLNPSGAPFGSLHQPYTSGGLRAPGIWRDYSVDLSPAVGSPDVRIRVRFDSVDTLGQGFRGLLIDDVSVDGSDVAAGAPGLAGQPVPGGSHEPPGTPPGALLARAVVIAPVSGTSTFTTPGGTTTPLVRPTTVAVGTVVDTRRGAVRVTAAIDAAGDTRTGTFHDGAFEIKQAGDGVVELALRGGRFPHCEAGCTSALRRARTVRRLWGNASGGFRTRGRYASATVRGTNWLVEDHAGDTLVRVRRGSALVRDFFRDRDVIVNAGETYVARVTYVNHERGNPRFGQQYYLAVRDSRIVHIYQTSRIVLTTSSQP